MTTQIKICGLSTPETLDAAVEAGATHIGLVHFEKSPRHVSFDDAAKLRRRVPASVQVVLLLVNPGPELVGNGIGMVRPDIIQFHGNETPEWVKLVREQTGVTTWKALGLQDAGTLDRARKYEGAADMLLFDAPAKKLPGGTGTSFDWSLLAGHEHRMPWGLAGGLTPDNVTEALTMTGAPLADVSSGVESAPGVKDVAKIAAFCQAVRAFDAANR